MNPGRAWRVATVSLLAPLGLLAATPAPCQSVLDRPPNLSGGWIGAEGTLYFHFLHRFDVGDAPARKVSNSPTFLLAARTPGRTLVGFQYATSSDVAPGAPNEWEFFGRLAPFGQDAGAPLDLAVSAGYNQAAESVDGELSLARRLGPVRLLAVARALSNGYAADSARFALAGGLTLRLGSSLALAGDVASLLDRDDGEGAAWGVGLQIAIPYTPHTVSLHAANTTTGTLQGASRGADRVRYGFEFTIPVTISRYLGGRRRPEGEGATAPAAAELITIEMKGFRFEPPRIEVTAGTTVEWTNGDPLPHSSTADDGAWDSPLIEPGKSWRRTFERPGTYPFHCTPHPFMTGVVVVR